MTLDISVIIPAHNPDAERLRLTLNGLCVQTLDRARWELLIVDNASERFPDKEWISRHSPIRTRLIRETSLGLSAARRAGFREALGDVAVLVDDDNVLQPDYLEQALQILSAHPRVGLAGGPSTPIFESEPKGWAREFLPLLALRDLGSREIVSSGLRPDGRVANHYPAYAPIGAGMVLRRKAWESWLMASSAGMTDRRGNDLSSGGDNEIVLCAMSAGWEVGYFPSLSLSHLIPAGRLEPRYLARLNRGIQRSWMRVLTRYDANPWPPLSRTGAALRKIKSWFAYRAWSSPEAQIRWNGACGQYEGRSGHCP
jgi:glycosyltransferase involved in cell wall biosynthesis